MNNRLIYKSTVAFAFASMVAPFAIATPQISQATSSALEQGQTLSIQGSGFVRHSPDPHAVMFDMVEMAYLNGEPNFHHETFGELDPVLRVNEDPNTLWWKPSLGSTDALQAPSIVRELKGRTFHEGAHYQLKGYNSFLGWPSAYGGDNTPVDNTKLYAAWYLKMSYDPRYYWTVSPQSMVGDFIPGEKIEINGYEGRFIGIGTEGHGKGMLHFEIVGKQNANDLKGETLIGMSSGAQSIFPSEFAAGTGEGYETPGSNKYLRVWEDPSGREGVRISWTQTQVHGEWNSAPVTPNEWHLMEFMLDTSAGSLRVYTDRNLVASVDIGAEESFEGKWSPTIALLGFNGKTQEFQDVRVDDIYMDKSFARVVIGQEPNFSELDNYELQYPVKWGGGAIDVRLNFGAINPDYQSYLYVINEAGEANEKGFPLCPDCSVPPSKIGLSVD